MPSLFVSRSLAPDSPLRKWASKREYDLHATSLIRFRHRAFDLPDEAIHWFFFYSPRSVDFWLKGLSKRFEYQPKLAAIGPGTKAALEDSGLQVEFCGQGDPLKVAADFLKVAKGQTVLFPRALQSRRSVEKYVSKHIQAIDLIVYENTPKPRTDLLPTDIVILTSPLNVEAYFRSSVINRAARFLAIGSTTAAALVQYAITADYPEQPGEAGLVELLNAITPPA